MENGEFFGMPYQNDEKNINTRVITHPMPFKFMFCIHFIASHENYNNSVQLWLFMFRLHLRKFQIHMNRANIRMSKISDELEKNADFAGKVVRVLIKCT